MLRKAPRKTSLTSLSPRSPIIFALLAATVWVSVYNLRFWADAVSSVQPRSPEPILFIGSIFVVLSLCYASALLLLPGTRLLKTVTALAFVVAAIASYFADTYGAHIDREMIRNTMETDAREVLGLMNTRFVLYVSLLGILPAVAVFRFRLHPAGWKQQLLHRGAFVAASIIICFSLLAALSAHYASFLREHKSVRYLITPANVVYGALSYLGSTGELALGSRVIDREAPVSRVPSTKAEKPLIVFLVIGETARAGNFQLGGYARATNPELATRGVYYFRDVSACGTSTAVSLPCMFSGSGRQAFDSKAAKRSTNLLDALLQGGISIEWQDNNAGCKGICARVLTVNHPHVRKEAHCGERGCFDEVMLTGVRKRLSDLKADTVIVFHQAGSHGPAYYERYPAKFQVFTPACPSNDLGRCPAEHVVNAYDNSILYTDYNLSRQIDMLKEVSESLDSMLLYVSDHGESLGEARMYLHGAPYGLAPEQQTKIPFLLWMSPGYSERFSISSSCLRAKTNQPMSHDNLYHTVLGALGVRTARYQASLDLLSSCKLSPSQ